MPHTAPCISRKHRCHDLDKSAVTKTEKEYKAPLADPAVIKKMWNNDANEK